ncbi:MAG TPA: cyanophycinase [Dermatophilaceae bacterium]|nr:cyanophycinase [Dermatophilaceae bacterium]
MVSNAGPADEAGMPPTSPPVRRTLLIVGGAEDKLGRSVVLRRFVRLAGGRASRIVVIPTASSFSTEASALYRSVFARLKAGQDFEIVHPPTRAAASSAELVARLDAATGIFMTGGSQLKLSQNIVGTPVGDAIHRAYQRGAVIAGTSAGASIMSQFMISLGDEGVTPRQRSSQLSAGLGLVTGVVVDQHFDQRGRYGRLLSIVANSPNLIGIGIDENTAAEIRDERLMSVVGAGAVFVLDARHAITDAPEARRGAPLLVSGAVVHTLPAGATFDLESVELVRFVERHPDIEVAVVAAKDRSPMVPAHAAAPQPR